MATNKQKPVFYWHIHHHILVESLIEPIENRVAFIKERKPEHERETRLRLMQPVKGKLPNAVVKAWDAYLKARVAYNKAWKAHYKGWKAYDKAQKAWERAWKAYYKALAAHKDEIEALHAKECPNCSWDGKTIFPEEI